MKGGAFRGLIVAVSGLIAGFGLQKSEANHYPDPILKDPYKKPRRRKGTRFAGKPGKPRYGYPPCHPGTIAYHDKLVRHFGRREADRIGREYRAGNADILPLFSEVSK